MNSKTPQELGKEAELYVEQVLLKQNWTILGKNIREVGSEIDLIAMKGTTLVFVEVKCRNSHPSKLEELLNARKRKALEKGALKFLEKKERGLPHWETLRFDLALVHCSRRGTRTLKYFAGV